MKESVIYQEILQEGIQQGLQQGLRQEGLRMVLLQLRRRFGKIDARTRQRIEQLLLAQLEDLGGALLDFKNRDDLKNWLDQQATRQ